MVGSLVIPGAPGAALAASLGSIGAAPAAEGTFTPVLPGLILLLPLLGAVVNGVGAFLWRDRKWVATAAGTLSVGAAFVVVLVNFLSMAGGGEAATVELWRWMEAGGVRVGVDLLFDRLSLLMMMIVTGVGTVIHVYSVGYMREDPGYSRYFSYLNLFVFFMLVLVAGANFPVLFVGWEGVGLCSYLLIGFWYENRAFADAGKKAFVVNRIGDAGYLVAMFMIFAAFGTLDFREVLAAAPGELAFGGFTVTAITLLLFLACTGKSAQIPLYVWLPDAMAGPTPVSALIHAATMVTAGVYLVVRTGVLFAMAPLSQGVVAAVGAATALLAATVAVQQYDIKKVLAYSTISQLGYMFLAVGVGAFTAGIFHLMTHAFFKALLFLGAGAVIHAVEHAWHAEGRDGDPNDMRNHGGLRRWMPVTWITMWAATLAIAGVFPFAGFFSKDEIIWAAGTHGFPVLWAIALLAALLTAAYMTRLMVMTFHGENRTGEDAPSHLHEAPAVMWIPLAVLGVLSVVGGWVQIPEALPLPHVDWLHHWLDPVTAPAHAAAAAQGVGGEVAHSAPPGGGETFWAAFSTAAALLVVLATARVLGRRRYRAAEDSAAPEGFARVLHDQWYVDELYERTVVGPLRALSRACWTVVDDGIVDGTANGLAYGARVFGWMGSRLQSGRIGTYLAVFSLGVIVLVGALVL